MDPYAGSLFSRVNYLLKMTTQTPDYYINQFIIDHASDMDMNDTDYIDGGHFIKDFKEVYNDLGDEGFLKAFGFTNAQLNHWYYGSWLLPPTRGLYYLVS